MTTPPLTLAVLGATASGKTRLALDLADLLARRGVRVEIVNADAMARYRGLDIGTAKPDVVERVAVPHHQLDVLDPREEASVRTYQADARRDAAAIRARGGVPLYVGGSGLYLRAALDELDIPPTDPAVRARLDERAARIGAEALHAELAAADPEAAARIAVANVRRVVRALEVIDITGLPFSASRPDPVHHLPTLQIGIRVAPAELDRRIAVRAGRMLAAGLVEEAVALRAAGWGRTAAAAVGYPQALAVADGMRTREEAREDIALATRRLAKRQRTWFRADPRTRWVEPDGGPDTAARALAEDALRALDAVTGAADGPSGAAHGGPGRP